MAEQGRIGRLFETFDRLSTREKMLVGGLVSALLITAAVVIWLVIGRQISNLEERNKGLRETLAQVNEQKTDYLSRKRRLDAYQRRLEENDVKLVRLMESQATKLGITIEDFKENKRFITEKHKKLKKTQGRTKVKDLLEESQTVTIRRVSLEQLTRFLAALESRQEPIKVTQLKIDTLSSDRQVLRQVQLTVSTYRNEEVDLL
ncbi:MAG: type II secretion system protein GspM [bacterium]